MSGGHRARRWGFHRLRPDAASALVAAADVHRGDLVLDLGAGTGQLVDPLVAAGARVLAVELHPGRVDVLHRRFDGHPQVTVVARDLSRLLLPRQPFRVVANPPWALAVPLLRTLTAPGSLLLSADLVLPRGVVIAAVAEGRGIGRPFRAEWVRPLGPAVFDPAPPGPAAVLRLWRAGRTGRAHR